MNRIIEADSALRRLPSNLAPRHRALLDGIRFSAEMCELAFERLIDSLVKISQERSADGVLGGFAAPFSDAWTMIDAVNRMRPLTERLPGANRGDVTAAFMAATARVYTLRNAVQHLHGRLDKIAADKLPTWGTITWLSAMGSPPRFRMHVLVPGAMFQGEHALENPTGLAIRAPLDHVRLRAHGAIVTITDLPLAVRRLISFLEGQITYQFKDVPTSGSDTYIEVEVVPDADADQRTG